MKRRSKPTSHGVQGDSFRASRRSRQGWSMSAIVAIVALALLYLWVRPQLERWTGLTLPSLPSSSSVESQRSGGAERDKPTVWKDSEGSAEHLPVFPPDNYDNESIISPAGLEYGQGPGSEHRLDHVLRHMQDDPSRDIHSVFDGDRYDICRWIDEAYQRFKKRDGSVAWEASGNDRIQITADMGQVIGYEGGRRGRRDGYPELRKLRLILEDDGVVITAYPCR